MWEAGSGLTSAVCFVSGTYRLIQTRIGHCAPAACAPLVSVTAQVKESCNAETGASGRGISSSTSSAPEGMSSFESVASLTMRCERLIDQPAVRMMALTDVLGQPKNSIALHQRRMALPRECPGRGAAGAPRAALGPQITRRAMDADPWECEKCSA